MQERKLHFSKSLLLVAANNYFVNILNIALMYLVKYYKSYIDDKKNDFKDNNIEERKQFLDRYREMSDIIYYFSFDSDIDQLIEKNKLMIEKQKIDVDLDALSRELKNESNEFSGKLVKATDKFIMVDSFIK